MMPKKIYKCRNKIHHKCEDFHEDDDLTKANSKWKTKTNTCNLFIDEDFDEKGLVKSCHKPSTAVDIDPYYAKDAALQSRTKKFQMKTDVLRLREIVRTKFLVYSTKERNLQKQQDVEQQEQTYQRIYGISIFIQESLNKIEREAFDDMKDAQKCLKDLQDIKIGDEYKETMAEHQRVMMDVQEIFGRFLFLLKLICYFDDIIDPEDIQHDDNCIKIGKNGAIFDIVISDRQQIGKRELSLISDFMDKTVRPYLSRRNHLNADIWIKGYERSRQKIFNYYRRCSQVALLNYLITIMYNKKYYEYDDVFVKILCNKYKNQRKSGSEKTFARLTEKPVILKQPEFLKKRAVDLKQCALRVWDKFERKQKQDVLQMTVNAILPVILKRIPNDLLLRDDFKSLGKRNDKKQFGLGSGLELNDDDSVLAMIQKLQWLFMNLLNGLEKIPENQRRRIERQVRKRKQREMANSSKALIEQNRFNNWMEHFKKHQRLYQK